MTMLIAPVFAESWKRSTEKVDELGRPVSRAGGPGSAAGLRRRRPDPSPGPVPPLVPGQSAGAGTRRWSQPCRLGPGLVAGPGPGGWGQLRGPTLLHQPIGRRERATLVPMADARGPRA